eukprot:3656814-Pyramimonas_sp.AAC.1
MRRRSGGLPRMRCATYPLMIFSIVYFEAVIYVEVLQNSLDALDFAFSNRLVVSLSQAFCRWATSRIHPATQTISMRPDPRSSLKVGAPGRSPHWTQRSAVGKMFAKTNNAPV